jgi:hypothetical protein
MMDREAALRLLAKHRTNEIISAWLDGVGPYRPERA